MRPLRWGGIADPGGGLEVAGGSWRCAGWGWVGDCLTVANGVGGFGGTGLGAERVLVNGGAGLATLGAGAGGLAWVVACTRSGEWVGLVGGAVAAGLAAVELVAAGLGAGKVTMVGAGVAGLVAASARSASCWRTMKQASERKYDQCILPQSRSI